MSQGPIAVNSWRVGFVLLACLVTGPVLGQTDPQKLLSEADRLAWLRVWTRAEPLYASARQAFLKTGDKRNALYAEVNELRGQLPRLAVPDVSERLSLYLDNPLVQHDDRLRLRVLTIKAETDVDLDPSLSQRSWTEALALAEKLGEAGWANRAKGELGLVAFLQGDANTAIVNLGQALKVAEASGDTSSVVRWLTLFGHGYVELNRPEQAIDFYDRALKIARTVPELRVSVMTLNGKADALLKLDRAAEAEDLIKTALTEAKAEGALGYEAELTVRLGLIALQRKDTTGALDAIAHATEYAQAVGANRILATIAMERARILRATNRLDEAQAVLRQGVRASRSMGERLLLPRLLAELADVEISMGRRPDAADLLAEADDLLEGLLTNASSPWVRGRILGSMDEIVSARIRLEGERNPPNPARAFSVVERARARSLVELLHARPLSDIRKPEELRSGERRIAALQLQLLRTTSRTTRQRLLDEIFVAEEQLAPMTTEMFARSSRTVRSVGSPRDVQSVLRPDEVLLEIALAEPTSLAIVITNATARVQRLGGRSRIVREAASLVAGVRAGQSATVEANALGTTLLSEIPELRSHSRLIIGVDGILQQVPFELLVDPRWARPLLDSHVVSYVPSAGILTMLRTRTPPTTPQMVLAIGSSPDPVGRANAAQPGPTTRGVYDLDASRLRPLPLATEEAQFVGTVFGERGSRVLVRNEATEAAVKTLPISDYRIVHLAAHGIMSTKVPARSAIVLRPSGVEDGLLQAREILDLRLNATLVTLSACDTSTGADLGQDGVASLVRPFMAAGSRAVVANLWAVDDTFGAALMREFYQELAAGADIGQALRRAKMKMIASFGPAATPMLWSGLLAYGDAAAVVAGARPATHEDHP